MEKIHIEQIRPDLTWRIRHMAMYPELPYQTIKLENDHDGLHFGLFAGDQLVSVVSLFNEETVYQFRKFATIPEFQGRGYGSLLLQHLINYVSPLGASMLWCNARSTAITFYAKFGFSETEDRFSKTGLEFVIMQLQLNN
ncbi:GNAT family N-acetyltransferase [Pedobacter gandavensis]|uniref:GNAT family N-acetyltransferase n=1 Tax=Pedobacter gandavensis TaxID=2679963 RepID=A0ABR6EWI3_9SPHI|nr:GNAT family N-acetyltransferase [Pedobacter gandavensis]MBB2149546.1 GNAT family N-acetyltransferase [Pedobacter gandavensis]